MNKQPTSIKRFDPCLEYIGRDSYAPSMEEIAIGDYVTYMDYSAAVDQRDTLLEFVEEVRRSGDTRLASMAIAVLNKVKEIENE